MSSDSLKSSPGVPAPQGNRGGVRRRGAKSRVGAKAVEGAGGTPALLSPAPHSDPLWRLYLEMLRVRIIERRISERYSQQEMRCPVHLSIGQEAVAVGVCAHLRKDDRAMSAHRSHGHYLAKGGNVHAMIAELYGRKAGCCGGRGGSMHLMDRAAGFWGAVPIVGSTLPIALGLALSDKRSGRN